MFAALVLPVLMVAAFGPLTSRHLASAAFAAASASAGPAGAFALAGPYGSAISSQAYTGHGAGNSIIQRTIAEVISSNGKTRQRYDNRFDKIAQYLGRLVRTTPVTANIEFIIDRSRQLSTDYWAKVRASLEAESAWASQKSEQSVQAFAAALPAESQQNQLVQHYLGRISDGPAHNAQVLASILDAVEEDFQSTMEQNYAQGLLLKSQALNDFANEAVYQESLIELFDDAHNVLRAIDAKYWDLKKVLVRNLGQRVVKLEGACRF